MKFRNSLALIVCSLLMSLQLLAQVEKGNIRGFVYESKNGQAVSYVTVSIVGDNTKATASNSEGFYQISGLEPGQYKIMAEAIGFDSLVAVVNVEAGKVTNQNLIITEAEMKMKEVVVSAEKQTALTQAQVSVIKITPKQIYKIPAMGGSADVAQYLQVIPGITFTGDQGGQLFIRGGAPVQNKVLLDGMTIYNPFHSIGFYSVFETDVIRSMDLYTGGFRSEFGGRASAILDITTREGNKKRLSGKVDVSPVMAKVLLEGPIIKLNEEGSSMSYMITGKHAYLDQTAKNLYPYVNNGAGLPFNFTDLYGKVSYNSENGSKVNVYGFNYNDNVAYPTTSFNWKSTGYGANFKILPGSSKMLMGGKVNYSDFSSNFLEKDQRPRTSAVGGFNAALDFKFVGDKSEFSYGVEFTSVKTNFNFFTKTYKYDPEVNSNEIGVFMHYRHRLGRLIIEPGARLQYYASLGQTVFEPRFAAKVNFTDNFRFKFAGGYHTQNLVSAVNEQDIVNFFQGYLLPDGAIALGNTAKTTDDKLQRSIHAIGGFELDFGKYITVNVEPYWKGFSQVVGINRNKVSAGDPNFFAETGSAYGIDFTAKYNRDNVYVYFAYALGYVKRDDNVQEYYANFDRRHNINFVASYEMGKLLPHSKAREWDISLRWNLASGFPFTKTQAIYGNPTYNDGVATETLGQNPDLGIIYSDDRNGGRLPYYHRLDVAIKRKFDLGKYSRLEIAASVSNLYDRANIFYFNRLSYSRVDQLPILPTLSASFIF